MNTLATKVVITIPLILPRKSLNGGYALKKRQEIPTCFVLIRGELTEKRILDDDKKSVIITMDDYIYSTLNFIIVIR